MSQGLVRSRVAANRKPVPIRRNPALRRVGDHTTAIELKYLGQPAPATLMGKTSPLPNQGAQDVRSYDVVKDITRVESFVAAGTATDGLVIVLTN